MVNVLPERHYRKPPLIEVLADFHFEPIQDREWDPKNLSQFATAIKELEEALRASEAGKWWMLVVEAQDRMGSAYYRLRRPQEAGRWFE